MRSGNSGDSQTGSRSESRQHFPYLVPPACIIKDLTGSELTRRCVWHKGIDESAGDKKPAAKTTNPRQIEAKRKRDEVTKATSENDAKRKKTGEPEEQSPQRARSTPARRARPPDRFSPSGGPTYAV